MASKCPDNLSGLVYSVLDIAGTNKEIKNVRKTVVHFVESYTKMVENSTEIVLTGSTAEGLFPFMRSDFDGMLLPKGIVCVGEANEENDVTTLQADPNNTPPGYVRLVALNLHSNRGNKVLSTLCFLSSWYEYKPRQPYISSCVFLKLAWQFLKSNFDAVAYNSVKEFGLVCNGPAMTYRALIDFNVFDNSLAMCIGDVDVVVAIPFHRPNTFSDWVSRPRFHDWPTKDLIIEISSLEVHVIPFGEKGSENQSLEWRISYVTAEMKLLSTFNSTQDKLFALLKMLSKDVLTPVCKNFSSYIMKNVVLWVAERNPTSVFQPHFLLDLILLSLNFIKSCLLNNHLPAYMLPTKNLIAGRILGFEKNELVRQISALLGEGKTCVFRIPRISEYLNYVTLNPRVFVCYGRWRNDVETLLLTEAMIILEKVKEDMAFRSTGLGEMYLKYLQDERCLLIQLRLLNLVVPDWIEKCVNGQVYEVIYLLNERTKAVWSNEMTFV